MSYLSQSLRINPMITDQLICDDERVAHIMPNGMAEVIPWHEIQEVSIVIEEEKLPPEDIRWELLGEKTICGIPGGTEGMDDLLPYLQRLPRFDNEMLVKAMSTTGSARFVCWRRKQ